MSTCCCAQRSRAAVYVVMCPLAGLCVLMLLCEEGGQGRERERERERERDARPHFGVTEGLQLEGQKLLVVLCWNRDNCGGTGTLAPQATESASCISKSVFVSQMINRNINVFQ